MGGPDDSPHPREKTTTKTMVLMIHNLLRILIMMTKAPRDVRDDAVRCRVALIMTMRTRRSSDNTARCREALVMAMTNGDP